MAIAIEASTVEAMMPNAGTPFFEMRLNRSGNRPSLAAASGISALIMIQPFSAPKPEMMTAMAITLPAQVPPNIALTASGSAPYSEAVNTMFGGTWAGNVMAIAVIISGFGALNGWIMISAEMPLAAANDGLFPDRFKRMSSSGVPAFGVVVSAVLSSVAVIVNYLGSSGATVFTTLILMTGITAAIPYGFSALAQLKWRWIDHREMQTPRFARDMIVAVLALVFSILFIVY